MADAPPRVVEVDTCDFVGARADKPEDFVVALRGKDGEEIHLWMSPESLTETLDLILRNRKLRWAGLYGDAYAPQRN